MSVKGLESELEEAAVLLWSLVSWGILTRLSFDAF